MNTAILTDSNSGISLQTAKDQNIYLISMPIIIDEQVYFEGENISEKEFYDALASDRKITTSMPSPGDLLELWDKILSEGYDDLVYIPMSSGLSNSCAAASALAQEYEGNVWVVDNHRISVTLAESVFTAVKLSKQGKSGKEIKDYLEEEAYNASIYITVNTLEYLKRGGRVTPAGAALATAFNIKPILTIQGEKLDSFAKTRGMKKAFQIMTDALKKEISETFIPKGNGQIYIGMAGTSLSDEEIETYINILHQEFPMYNVYYSPLPLSIGCHVGPKALGIGTVYVREL